MTGRDLQTWRRARRFTRRQLSALFGTTETSLYRWERAAYKVPQVIEILVLLYEKEENIRTVQKKLHFPLD